MAIPPLPVSLLPALARQEALLEIARNVYVAPSESASAPTPLPGLLADLSPDDAPAPVTDRSEAAPAPSLIGLRAPRAAAPPPFEPYAPRPRDTDSATPRVPTFPRGAIREPARPDAGRVGADDTSEAARPSPAAPPSGARTETGLPGRANPGSTVPEAAREWGSEGAPSAARPNAGPVQAAPSVRQDVVQSEQDTVQARQDASQVRPDTAQLRQDVVQGLPDTAQARQGTVAVQQDIIRVQQDTVQAYRDLALAMPGDPPPRLPSRQPSLLLQGAETGATVNAPAPDSDAMPRGAAAEGRPPARSEEGPSAPSRGADRIPVSEPASSPMLFADTGQGGRAERTGIIASCILNAAMIPGWPPPRPFAVPKADVLLTRLGEIASVPTESDLLALLKSRGRPPARLARLRQRLAKLTKLRRLRTLLGLTALMATIETVLEAVEAELGLLARSGDDGDEPGADEARRRHLSI